MRNVIHSVLALCCLFFGMQASAQTPYTMTVEEHAVDGVAGTTTYRFYIDMVNPDDFLSSIYGNEPEPFSLSTGGAGFYNDPAATGGSAGGINPGFLVPPYNGFFPGLAFDSWFTIGIEFAPSGAQTAVSAVESTAQPWIGAFDATNTLSGQDVVMNDNTGGAWYVLNGTPNGLPDATNQRVLLMQVTTSGTVSGTINSQVFENGVGENDLRFTFNFEGPGTFFPDGYAVDVPGCTDEAACNYNADATSDDGSCELPAIGYDCDGICLNDADGDGTCDEFEIVGCQDATACNYDETATDAGECVYADGNCESCDGEGGVAVSDADGDGVCDADEVAGCTNAGACNYNADATDEDGSCEFSSCAGCTDDTACNYDMESTIDDGSCTYPGDFTDCEGDCNNDADADGVCDELEVDGCTDETACNYDMDATEDDGSCATEDALGVCGGDCAVDSNNNGVCDNDEVLGCTDPTACNFDPEATLDLGLCVYEGCSGCTDAEACNYDAAASQDDGSCLFADGDCESCNGEGGVDVSDADGDGVCDADEVAGCQDAEACNYSADATDEDGSCVYADDACESCNGEGGVDLNDADGDGVCDADEVAGCQDAMACNYSADATDDDGSCLYDDALGVCGGDCTADDNGNGICDDAEVAGCTDSMACNYDMDATMDDDSCEYESCLGCTDELACNYLETATTDDGSCFYAEQGFDCDGNPDACAGCEPEFSMALNNYSVQCEEDLPTMADESITAMNPCTGEDIEVSSFVAPLNEGYTVNTGTTSFGIGPDGAIRIYGLSALGLAPSDFFFETEPLTLVRYNNGMAKVTGTVVNSIDASYGFELHMVFEDMIAAEDWLAMSSAYDLITAYNCSPEVSTMDTYVLRNEQSFMTGIGAYEGSMLQLSHMPYSENRRFQLGVGGSSHNCEYGFGGWFAWDGQVMGHDVMGMSGDLIIDLSEDMDMMPGCGEEGVEITYTAINDECSLVANVTQVIDRNDTEGPSIEGPGNEYASCEAVPAVPSLDAFTVTDNCNDPEGLEFVYLGEDTINVVCPNTYVLVRSWSATDCSGNETIYTQEVQVEDLQAPVFTYVPENMDLNCEDELIFDAATATDNCADITVMEDRDTVYTCAHTFTITRIFTAEDGCGNTSIAEQVINVVDDQAPVFESFDSATYAACEDIPDPEDPQYVPLVANDNCGMVSYSIDAVFSSGGCPGTWVRVWTATDECGNSTTVEQFVTLIDQSAPVITVPEGMVTYSDENCNADLSLEATGMATATDNCSGDMWNDAVTLTYVENMDMMPTCTGDDDMPEGSYTVTRTWTAVDYCDNSSTAVQTIMVHDTIAPVVVAETALANCSSYDPTVDYGGISATDNCDTDVAYTFADTDTINIEGAGCYTIVRTITATDDCGNVGYGMQYVTIEDTEGPIIDALPELQISCSEFDQDSVYATAYDACGGDVNLYVMNDDNQETGCVKPVGGYVRTYAAIDECGNMSTAEQIIILTDDIAPEFSYVPADTTIECDATVPFELAEAFDNCAANVTVTSEDSTVDLNATEYIITRTFTATDDCGNSSTATQTINVVDTTPPTIVNIIPELTITPEELLNFDFGPYEPYCIDNCAEGVTGGGVGGGGAGHIPCTLVIDTIPGDCMGNLTLNLTFSHTDDANNTTEGFMTIFVVDSEAPTFVTVPADTTLNCTDALPMDLATATDNASTVDMIEIAYSDSIVDGACAGNFTVLRTHTATDDCGNTAEAVQTITFVDEEAPVITAAETITIDCGAYDPDADYGTVAMDNCSADSLVTLTWNDDLQEIGCVKPIGAYVRTYTATDDCGNSSEAIQFILLQDEEAPVLDITCPENVVLAAGSDTDSSVTGEPTWEVSDNCDMDVDVTLGINDEMVAGACSGASNIERTFTITAVDHCGNETVETCVQIIELTDVTAPVFTLIPEDQTNECAEQAYDFDAEDDLNGVTIVEEREVISSDECGNYEHLVSLIATDGCGNADTVQFTIIVQDTMAPMFNEELPADATVECDAVPAAAVLTASDNCEGDMEVMYSETRTDGACPQTYTLTRVWSASDCSGNSVSHTQTIEVQDTTAPVITATEEIEVSCENWPVLDTLASATDNCGAVTLTFTEAPVSGGCVMPYGRYERVYSAEDECGNVSTFNQFFTLVDTVNPVFTTVPADLTLECDEPVPTDELVEATDNCDNNVSITMVEDTTEFITVNDYTLTRTFTATDHCGNTATAVQTITVADNVPPEVIVSVPTLDLSPENWMDAFTIAAQYEPLCIDNCDNTTGGGGSGTGSGTGTGGGTYNPSEGIPCYLDFDSLPGDCYGNFTGVFGFNHTDISGNLTTVVMYVYVADTTAPEITFVPADVTVECDGEMPTDLASGVDNYSPDSLLVISYEDVVIATDCAQEYTIERTHSISDDCGNTSTAVQIITVVDTTAPMFTSDLPMDMTAECFEVPAAAEMMATDNCDDMVTVEFTADTVLTECAGVYTINRHWTATDCAGNSTSTSQTIEVVDTTGPELVTSCGYENGETAVLCDDGSGFMMPDTCEVDFVDACGSAVDVVFTQEVVGDLPDPESGVQNNCTPSDPEPITENGLDCSLYSPHSLRMFGANFTEDQFYVNVDGNVENLTNGGWAINQTVVSTMDPTSGWTISMNYGPGYTWDEWIALPGSQGYFQGCGDIEDLHTDWMYYILEEGTLTGYGAYDGTVLNLAHQPSNAYFGLQVGMGASGKNANYGYVAWFLYEGEMNGMDIMGSGDIFGDLDCAQPMTINRHYVATDCAGNTTEYSYSLVYTGESCPDMTGLSGSDVAQDTNGHDNNFDGNNGNGAFSSLHEASIRLVGLSPNPTNTQSVLRFVADSRDRVSVTIYSLSGARVADLFEGEVFGGNMNQVLVPVSDLSAGMYQIRIVGSETQLTTRLLVTE